MAEHLRALVVVFALSAVSFLLLHRPALALGMANEDFKRRRNLWMATTTIAFVANSFWIFIIASAVLLVLARRAESRPIPLYLALLFVVPPFSAALPGLGVINQLFELSYPRLLALVVLLPWVFSPEKDKARLGFGRHPVDWLVLAFLGLQIVAQLRTDSLTNTMRFGVYTALDAFLPYYVASRSLRTVEDFRAVFLALAFACLLMVPIAVFEYAKYWLLYSSLPGALGMVWDGGSYLGRGDSLRSIAATGHPIVLGYVMAIALFFLAGVPHADSRNRHWLFAMAALAVGLAVSLSRGPWVGAAVGIIAMTATAQRPALKLLKLAGVGAVIGLIVVASPWGARLIDLLPFVGTVDSNNVEYRQKLFDASMLVISQHPFFGSPYFMYEGPMQDLRVGNLIDVVNSYLLIALNTGYLGLGCFASAFIGSLGALLRALKRQPAGPGESRLQGRALLGALVAALITIATVSNILFIPILYWCLAGLAVAYSAAVPLPARAGRAFSMATDLPRA